MEAEVEDAVNKLAKDDSFPAVPASSIPLREDQIGNAIAFLSHAKVRDSTPSAKRSFLEGKGLTAAEIQEAFKRVPGSSLEPTGGGIAGQGAPPKPFPTAPSTALIPGQPQPQQQQQVAEREPLRWTQVVAGAGGVALAVWLAQAYLYPPVARWWRGNKDQEPSPADRAAAAVATAIAAQTAEMRSTMDGMRAMLKSAEDAKHLQPEPLSLLELREELRGLATSMQQQQEQAAREAEPREDARLATDMQELKMLVTALASNALKAQQSSPSQADGPAFSRPAPQTNGYANGGNHLEPSRQYTNGQQYNGQQYNNGHSRGSPPPPAQAARPPQSPPAASPAASGTPSYMDVLEMLEKGETPPGIRTDIQDSPPNPSQPPPASSQPPRTKPWERANSSQSDKPDKGPWKPPSAPAPSIFAQGGSRPSSTAGSDVAGAS